MLVPNRHGSSNSYRYGYGGHEKDNELKGDGNHLSFVNYGYDPRIGRRFNEDPRFKDIPGVSPYSYALNNPNVYIDEDGQLPILPLLLKAGAAGAADMLTQAAIAYYFDPNVKTVGQAFDKVNWWQVARSSAEGLIPWKTPGGKFGRAGATATADVLVNALNEGGDYTQEKALNDFIGGFLSDLSGGGMAELLTRYGTKHVANVLRDKLGFDYSRIKKLTGISGRYTGSLRKVNKPDVEADMLAKKLGGESRVKFDSDKSNREFDVVSDQYIGQAKEINNVGSSFRNQAKATFEAAQETNKKVYYQLNSDTNPEVIKQIKKYSERYKVEVVIELVKKKG